MTIWAYEVCWCRFETGYQVEKLFDSKEKADDYMDKNSKDYADGVRVREWQVD